MREGFGLGTAAGDVEPETENKQIGHLLCTGMRLQLVTQGIMTHHIISLLVEEAVQAERGQVSECLKKKPYLVIYLKCI